MPRALFLDRDGTINVDYGYVHRREDFEFVDGIFDVCRLAQRKGFKIFVVTNQSGIARKMFTESEYQRLTRWMKGRFHEEGVCIEAVYHCPHLEGANRKPNPGMFIASQRRYKIDMTNSISVGDSDRDIEASKRAGIKNCFKVNNRTRFDAVIDFLNHLPS